MAAVNSMSFIAPNNKRHAIRGARGTRQSTTSLSAELAQWLMVVLIGFGSALVVRALSDAAKVMMVKKLELVHHMQLQSGAIAAWAVHAGLGLCFVCVAFTCAVLAPFAKGSGLPHLIAYLNGCKLIGFTSFRTLCAKLVGTSFSLAAGLFVGPEGPMIHLGGCVGKQMLRLLHRSSRFGPRTLVAAFSHLQNDLDQRDAVAIGAGAAITTAFLAPISGTIFVVEEASSHFSLSLLWRAFTASIAALWACHWLETADDNDSAYNHKFQIKFDFGQFVGCTDNDSITGGVLGLAVLGGLTGSLFNMCILYANQLRVRLTKGRRSLQLLDAAVILLVSSTLCVGLPAALSCEEPSVGWLELGLQCPCAAAANLTYCKSTGQCPMPSSLTYDPQNGTLTGVCSTIAFENAIPWASRDTHTCFEDCLYGRISGAPVAMLASTGPCPEGQYSPLGSLLLQPSDNTVRALFIRGAPYTLPAHVLAIALACWFCMTALTAGITAPLGLMIPMIIIGGCLGRLYCLLLLHLNVSASPHPQSRHLASPTPPLSCASRAPPPLLSPPAALQYFGSLTPEPGLFALLGATSILAGSGQIRLFFTMVMLEVAYYLLWHYSRWHHSR